MIDMTTMKNKLKFIKLGIILSVLYATGPVQADGVIFYSLENGSLVGLHMGVGPYTGAVIGPAFDTPPVPGTIRSIAYDRFSNLMWYAASDNNVRSIDWFSGSAGPIIDDINDAFLGATRTIAIDENGRRLYISNSNGDVEVYELINNTYMYTIPLLSWGVSEPNPGNRRQLAVDDFGFLWYAAADGSFKQFNPVQSSLQYTGIEIPFSQQIGINPGQDRYFDIVRWPAGQRHLYYAASDSSIRVLDLDTLSSVNIQYPASDFSTISSPGVLRAFSIDETWVPGGDTPTAPTNVAASKGAFSDRVRISWSPVSQVLNYIVYRRDPGQIDWTVWITSISGNTTTADDTATVPGINYEYSVRAFNQFGGGAFSDFDTGWSASQSLQPPSNITATQGDFDDRIELTWNSVPGAESYTLLITIPTGGSFFESSPTNSFTHFATGPLWNVWRYKISSCSLAAGCSTLSPETQGWMGDLIFSSGFE